MEKKRDEKPGTDKSKPARQHTGQAENPGAGADRLDMNRTPGDGTLQGATPAGLSAEELRRRAEDSDRSAEPGTG